MRILSKSSHIYPSLHPGPSMMTKTMMMTIRASIQSILIIQAGEKILGIVLKEHENKIRSLRMKIRLSRLLAFKMMLFKIPPTLVIFNLIMINTKVK